MALSNNVTILPMKESSVGKIKNPTEAGPVRGVQLNEIVKTLINNINAVITDFAPSTNTLKANTIEESTSGAGVIIDNLAIKDGGVVLTKGIVTQITAITTGVTVNAPSGIITTVSSTLAAGSNAAFIVSNSFVTADSSIQLTIDDSATAGIGKLNVQNISSGEFSINISNIHSTNAFNNILKIHFLIL